MTDATAQKREGRSPVSPELVIIAGCVIALLTFGPRSAVGAFQKDILEANHWGRDTFGLAIAVQNLLWGVGQPFAGALADRFGAVRVLCVGILYAAGLMLMAVSHTALSFTLSAGLLIGFGLAGCSFNLVLGAFGKLVPERMRSMAFGLGTAAGSLGQFLFSPLGYALIRGVGWQEATIIFGCMMLLILPLATFLATPSSKTDRSGAARQQSLAQALSEAFGHRSYMLLVIGFFTCGFQLAFITVHFQIYLTDIGLGAGTGAIAFGIIGIFNMIGSILAGWLGNVMPRRWILSVIYLLRSLSSFIFISLPPSEVSAIAFGAITGLLWLSTVPPTSSLIGVMFGARYFTMLYGFAFFSHQLGGFLGVWLGGVLYEHTGSYTIVWWLSVALGLASAAINLPIVEKPVAREGVLVAT